MPGVQEPMTFLTNDRETQYAVPRFAEARVAELRPDNVRDRDIFVDEPHINTVETIGDRFQYPIGVGGKGDTGVAC